MHQGRLQRTWTNGLNWITARTHRSVVLVGLAALTISASLSQLGFMPQPWVHDEFSYLLAADTFAHGRLTNPTHPMWVHFEALHILQQPTYASKYPPGQGLMLALGQVLTGYPIVGVWLSVALACAAICWMLQAWLPPRWALLGGLIAALHPLVLQWSQNYWGGAVAMGGGALLLGAVRRLAAQPRVHDGIIMGLGVAILANSRPYEGAVLSFLVSVALLLPVCLVLVPMAGATAYYNFKVTGNALRMPHQVYEETYAAAPTFFWLNARPIPTYHHQSIRDTQVGWALNVYLLQRSPSGFVSSTFEKLQIYGASYFPSWGLIMPLIMLPWMLKRDRWTRLALLIVALFLIALLVETWWHAHYAAPITALMFAIALQAMRYLYEWRLVGRLLVGASLMLCLVAFVMQWQLLARTDPQGTSWRSQRARIISSLNSTGEKHLILVRYKPGQSVHLDWVHNGADIDGSPVVWAREMDAAQNRKLLEYFHDRKVWLLIGLDPLPWTLFPYGGGVHDAQEPTAVPTGVPAADH